MDGSVTHLQVEPTTRCNFTCGFCAGRHMEQADLTFEDFERALSRFPSVQHLELQGEGEPLMHPRFFDMVALARQRNIAVSFITNGSYFTPERVEKILDHGISTISVSIESASPEQFREIRGGKLEKVLEGIERLVTRRNARGLKSPSVGFAVMVMRSTRTELETIAAIYERLHMDGGIGVQMLQRMSSYADQYDAAMTAEVFEPSEMALVWRSAGHAFASANAKRKEARAATFYAGLVENWKPQTGQCFWLERGAYVANNGTITPCCYAKDGTRFGVGTVAGGAARIEKDSLRAALKNGEIPDACRGCDIAETISPRAARRSLPVVG